MRGFRAPRVWTGSAWLDDGAVVVEDGVLVELREGRRGDEARMTGWIGPGFVNAHCHLELSWAAGRVPGGEGLGAWVQRLGTLERPDAAARERAVDEALDGMARAGTAAVCDIHNGPSTAPAIARAGLVGIAQHELLGMDPSTLDARLADAARPIEALPGPVWRRPSPHGGYSTPPALVVAASRPGPVPSSIHVAEDPSELAFIARGEGPIADFLDRIGRDWSWWEPRGHTPIEHLDHLGVLGPGLLLVHGVLLTPEDRQRIAARGATLCLCPRSNLHIGGCLADVPALLEAGVRLAIGTDSLASSPDLDVRGEIAVLEAHFPEIARDTWLRAATGDGGRALGLGAGRYEPGQPAPVFAFDGDAVERLA